MTCSKVLKTDFEMQFLPGLFFSDLEVLRSFQNQIAAIQRDAVWWLHTVVPTISKVGAKDYVHWSVTVSSTSI